MVLPMSCTFHFLYFLSLIAYIIWTLLSMLLTPLKARKLAPNTLILTSSPLLYFFLLPSRLTPLHFVRYRKCNNISTCNTLNPEEQLSLHPCNSGASVAFLYLLSLASRSAARSLCSPSPLPHTLLLLPCLPSLSN